MNLKEILEKQQCLNEEISCAIKEINTLNQLEIETIKLENENNISSLMKTQENILLDFKNKINSLEIKIKNIIATANFKDTTSYEALNLILFNLDNMKLNLPSTPSDLLINTIPKVTESPIIRTQNNTLLENNGETLVKPVNKEKTVNTNLNIEKPLSTLSKKNSNENLTKNKSYEFKLGTNVLYIIGIVLILISLITFGRYVYVNFLSDLAKGICLFIISFALLILGETILKRKKSWFCMASISIGISGLYISLIINYLFLSTFNGTIDLILTVLITILSMYISVRNNSNIIRIITLLGSYLCLVPLDFNYSFLESLTVVIILILITASNMLLPLKKDLKVNSVIVSFETYCSLISLFFYIIFSFLLNINAVIILSISYMAIYNTMFIKSKSNDNVAHRVILIVSSVLLPLYIFKINSMSTITFILLPILFIQLVSIYLSSKEDIKWTCYIQSIITILIYLFLFKIKLFFNLYDSILDIYIGFLALLIISAYVFIKNKTSYSLSIFIIISIISLIDFLIPNSVGNELICTLYILMHLLILSMFSTNIKNSSLTKVFKYLFLFNFEYYTIIITSDLDLSTSFSLLIMLLVSYLYFIIINYVPLLRSKDIYKDNNVYTFLLTITTLLIGLSSHLNFYVTTLLLISLITFALNDKFIDTEKSLLNIICKNKPISYSILSTYIIFRLNFMDTFISNGITISILLMIVAFISVYIGFKLKTLSLRRYGLGLSLFICAKLIFADFYYLNFLSKTVLFLIVGLLSLGISYIYNKLEKELK